MQKLNKEYHENLWDSLSKKAEKVFEGGGIEKIKKLHSNNQLTARERVDFLLDKPKEAIEIGLFAAEDMYQEHGGCPSAGVVVKIGKVSNKPCIIVANDPTVKAGAWFPMTSKKNLRAQEIALENNIPIIYLVDSAGVFLPLQHEIFPDKEHFGRIFRNNAKLSAKGVVQIASVFGSCIAGGAYLPVMSDEVIMVKGKSSIFLAGPYLVKAAIGENADKENLGGADMHCDISGVANYKVENDEEALNLIKKLIDKTTLSPNINFHRDSKPTNTDKGIDLQNVLPIERNEPYDIRQIIKGIVDKDTFVEYSETIGLTIVCGVAQIEGWSVGIVANQRLLVKNAKGERQFGGVIYSDSAIKAADFIVNCNKKNVPLLFLQDVTGFMVGTRSEQGGIIKHGACLVEAVSNCKVPKFTVVVGNSYGAGNYAMCGKAYDPRFIVAWPTAEIGVMGAEQASEVILQMQKNKNEKDAKKLAKKVKEEYKSKISCIFAASQLWVDAIIHPYETRKWISTGIEIAAYQKK